MKVMRKLHKIALLILVLILVLTGAVSYADKQGARPEAASAFQKTLSQEPDFFESLNSADNASKSKSNEPSVFLTVISFIGKLILVLGIAYVCIFGLKKINAVKTNFVDSKKRIVVIEHTSISPGRQLHLVNIAGKSLLIGSTSSQINLLAELDPAQISEIEEQPSVGFKEQLSQFLGHNPKKEETAKSVAQLLRESATELRSSVSQVNTLRGDLRDTEDA